jgi:hypothetical protein
MIAAMNGVAEPFWWKDLSTILGLNIGLLYLSCQEMIVKEKPLRRGAFL